MPDSTFTRMQDHGLNIVKMTQGLNIVKMTQYLHHGSRIVIFQDIYVEMYSYGQNAPQKFTFNYYS